MRVIARAYKNRPLDRVAVGEDANVIFIAHPSTANSTGIDAANGIGFPKSCVFRFDPELFESLAAAWRDADQGRLTDLWSRGKVLEPGCVAAADVVSADA
jgi:hypothetical protein